METESYAMEFEKNEVLFWCALWAIGFVCGVSRYLRNGDYRSTWHSLSVGLFSGCFCVGSVLLALVYNLISGDHPRPAIGVAIILGLSSKEQVEAIGFVWGAIKRWLEGKINGQSSDKK